MNNRKTGMLPCGLFAAVLLSAALGGCGLRPSAAVTQVSAGDRHTMALKSDGSLWATGSNDYGQMGGGAASDSLRFRKVAENVRQVACGHDHTIILKDDGSVWGAGANQYGQLGDGSQSGASAWVRMKADSGHDLAGAKAVAACDEMSFVIKDDDTLWACGNNGYGGLGDGTTAAKAFPVRVLDGVKAVYSGSGFTFAVRNDGGVWITGYNGKGQLGNGNTDNVIGFAQLAGWANPRSIACGDGYSLFLMGDGKLWAAGSNEFGQFGSDFPTESHEPLQIATDVESAAAGWRSSYYTKSDGSLWSAGWNIFGQLGDGSTTGRKSFDRAKVDSSTSLENVKSVSDGIFSCIVIMDDDTLRGAGWNGHGQLGNGSASDSHFFANIP